MSASRISIVLSSLLVTVAVALAAPVPARLAVEVTRAAQSLHDATIAGELDTVVSLLHPRIVEKAGGIEATTTTLREMLARMSDAGLAFERYDVGQPAELFDSDGARHMFIPTTSVVGGPGGRIERTSWLLASQAKSGGGWVFIDGAGVADTASLADLFPGFPLDVRIPDSRRRVLPADAGALAESPID